MKIAIDEIGQETDTFNPLPTTLQFFKDYGLYLGDKILEMMPSVGMLGGFLEIARQQPEALEIVPLIRTWAGASGPLTAEILNYT